MIKTKEFRELVIANDENGKEAMQIMKKSDLSYRLTKVSDDEVRREQKDDKRPFPRLYSTGVLCGCWVGLDNIRLYANVYDRLHSGK